jgi:NADH dehydrogenase [ubiquinone] 1 alpha subcomplex assembly factor 7
MSSQQHNQALIRHFTGLINASGPVTVERWMADCLGHPEHGYYITRDPFGVDGDFITAPEISQMFGEILGLWCAQTWLQIGRPGLVRLVELGPGRGTLMADALRAARALPGFPDAIDVHLVETSPVLRQMQKETLADYQVTWHEQFEDVPQGPVLVLANELFDALPVRQFIRNEGYWHECLIDIDPDNADAFRLVTGSGPSPAASMLSIDLDFCEDGGRAELCPAGLRLAHAIGSRVEQQGGAALIIDYGYSESRPGDSLQALYRHEPLSIVEKPGLADITAHVDFSMLARSAVEGGGRVSNIVGQGAFLVALGLAQRAEKLKASVSPDVASEIDAAYERLTAPDQMGNLFRVMAISSPALGLLAGFEETS